MTYLLNKKIFVSGSAGLVGNNLYHTLEGLGCNVVGGYRTKLPEGVDNLINVDLTRKEDCLNATRGVDVVFHCAANTSGAAAMSSNPLQHVTPNIIMNANLLEAAYENGVKKFVWLASTTGYPELNRPAKEEDMFTGNPWDKYFYVGWTKRMTEKLCEMYSKLGMFTIVLRPTNIYGPGDKFDPAKSHVLPALIRKVVERQNPIEVWGDGNDLRDIIYVDDMVRAMLLAVENLTSFQPLNIGAGKVISVKKILEIIKSVEKYDAPVKFDISKPTMIPKREVCVDKAKELIGFEAKITPEEGIRETIEWFKNNK